jgi:hypothetical protein
MSQFLWATSSLKNYNELPKEAQFTKMANLVTLFLMQEKL